MADIVPIERKPTDEEEKDFINIGLGAKARPEFIIKKKLEEIEKKHAEDYKPFCYVCATHHIHDQIEKANKEAQRKGKTLKPDAWKNILQDELGYVEKAFIEKYFTRSPDFVKIEQKTVGISKVTTEHHFREFACKEGHKRSIEIPEELWEQKPKAKA